MPFLRIGLPIEIWWKAGGALLLRSAWTGDIVVDFVGTNPEVTKSTDRPLANVGAMLVYAAIHVGVLSSANLIWVETAAHSIKWWKRLLAQGEDFIRVDEIPSTHARLTKFFADANVAHQSRPS